MLYESTVCGVMHSSPKSARNYKFSAKVTKELRRVEYSSVECNNVKQIVKCDDSITATLSSDLHVCLFFFLSVYFLYSPHSICLAFAACDFRVMKRLKCMLTHLFPSHALNSFIAS